MISLTKRFAFIHINKAGGTSVVEALAAYEDIQCAALDHDPAFVYKNSLGTALWREFYSFAFLRNPFDRMVSSYEYRKQYHPDKPVKSMTFRDWITGPVVDSPLDREFGNQLWMVTATNDFRDILVKDLFLYEDLSSGFLQACKKIGIKAPPLGSYNKTNRRDFRAYYDGDTAAIVAGRYSEDLAWADRNHPTRWIAP